MGGYAWVTLATNDAYSLGALVLAHSLRRVGTKHELACMVTPGVTAAMREKLAAVFSYVQEVNVLESRDEANLALLARPELGITFTKLHCWRLTQYEKCVFVDADTLVVRNCDELFDREELSAAPDVGWPDCFNSGVFVYRPSQETFTSLTAFAVAKGSFDGGDQGLLNMYFSDWATKDISKHLPFIYNMCSTATYSYLPAFKQFGEDVRIIHFIGMTKPWLQYFDTLTRIVQAPAESGHLQLLLQLWWDIFCEHVHPKLSESMATSTLAPIWREFTPRSYRSRSVPDPVYSDAAPNRGVYSPEIRAPDFSDFKDPWLNYCPENDPFMISNNVGSASHGTSKFYGYAQRIFLDGHSSLATAQTYNHQRHVPTSNDENNQESREVSHSQGNNHEHSLQHIHWYHHWQEELSELRCQDERHEYEHCRTNEHETHPHQQRHYHRSHEQNHQPNNERRQHEHQEAQIQQHDHIHRDQENDHHHCVHHKSSAREHYTHDDPRSSHSPEVRHEEDHHRQRHPNDNHQASHETSGGDRLCGRASVSPSDHTWEREQTLGAAHADTRTTDSSFLPAPQSAPCTDFHNVATRSDPNVTEHLDGANAGIAGALAQITLGEARSAQQIALEEHMRQQSWEQGQIDYMGRDSFDNIWKKICETLSLAPPQPPIPSTEQEATENLSPDSILSPSESVTTESAAPPDESAPAAPVVEADKEPPQPLICKLAEKKLPTAQLTEQEAPTELPSEGGVACPQQVPAAQVSSESAQTAELKGAASPGQAEMRIAERRELAIPQPPAPQDATPPLSHGEDPQQQTADAPRAFTCPSADAAVCKAPAVQETITPAKSDVPIPAVPAPASGPILPAAASIGADSLQKMIACPDVTQPLTIDPSEQHADMLLAASEVSTVSPVPIQVAESVLQAEPKESASSAAAASDQAIATTVIAVHESTNVAVAAAITPPELPVQLNGSAACCQVKERGEPVSAGKADTPAESVGPAKQPMMSDDVVTTEDAAPLEPLSLTAVVAAVAAKIQPDSGEKLPPQESSKEPSKPAQQAAKIETKEQQAGKAESTKPAKASATTPLIAEQASPAAEAVGAKELNIPSTPTVIEATPPVSPLAESAQELEEKTAKKSPLKKSDSADGAEADGEDKKAKKTAKKTVKKPKARPEETAAATGAAGVAEGAAAAESSPGKAKKGAKLTKKTGLKSGQSLEGDTNVPETPPPPPSSSAAGDVPVPPKRKTKGGSNTSGNAKGTTGKKPEAPEE